MPRLWHDRKCTPAADTATRKPLLSFRLSGLFLLRLAERQFLGLLFQEPPRSTRRLCGPDPLGHTSAKIKIFLANRGFAPVPQEG